MSTIVERHTTIIGAGLTGLNLGQKLLQINPGIQLGILEKSKSCGGRMATRRINDSRFDHGAQFIKRTPTSDILINEWINNKVLQPFPENNMDAYCGFLGMTQPAKNLSLGLTIDYNAQLKKFHPTSRGWELTVNESQIINTKNLILTCPLPQSLQLLSDSQITFDTKLAEIQYAKAIVFLLKFDSNINLPINYSENIDQDIFSLCSQGKKGMASNLEYTMVMTDFWSEKHFHLSDEQIINLGKTLIENNFKQNISNLNLKKWRFSHPKKIWNKGYYSPAPRLYLAGDAFGGPSLNGALQSSEQLFAHVSQDVSFMDPV